MLKRDIHIIISHVILEEFRTYCFINGWKIRFIVFNCGKNYCTEMFIPKFVTVTYKRIFKCVNYTMEYLYNTDN
jgi:hypothetical protein